MTLYINNSTGEVGSQADFILEDGRRDWHKRKKMTNNLADIVKEYDVERAHILRGCGTYLYFGDTGQKLKLLSANFCRLRICPMCSWRRSLKLGAECNRMYEVMARDGYDKHVFVTLTVKNVTADELNTAIDNLCNSFVRFSRSVWFKRSFLGSYRALEVTYNADNNTYHPHLHVLLTCNEKYFIRGSGLYWTKDDLIRRWRKSAHLDYDPSVSIETIKPKDGQNMTAACAEICKYPTKVMSFVSLKDKLLRVEVCHTIDTVLAGRRLILFSGIQAEYRRKLRYDDNPENGDLINVSGENVSEDYIREIVYTWRSGYYFPVDVKKLNAVVS